MDVYVPASESAYRVRAWYCLFDGFQELSWFSPLGFLKADTHCCSLGRYDCFYRVGRLRSDCGP